MAHVAPGYATGVRAQLSTLLLEVLPPNLDKFFFTTSRTEANEAAIKIARMVTGFDEPFFPARPHLRGPFGLVDRARVLGEYLGDKLAALKERHVWVGDVRGLGLFWTVDLVRNRAAKEPFNTKSDKIAGPRSSWIA